MIDKGGLGLKFLPDFNLALLNKWRWQILQGGDSLWFVMLKARHGDVSLKVLGGIIIVLKSPLLPLVVGGI